MLLFFGKKPDKCAGRENCGAENSRKVISFRKGGLGYRLYTEVLP